MTITVPAGFDPYSGRSAAFRIKLVDLIAERDGLPIHDGLRPGFHRAEAERRADDLIAAWDKAPRDPLDEIDHVLAAMQANAADCLRARQAGTDRRAAMVAGKLEPLSPTVTVKVMDAGTGRMVDLMVPRAMLRFS